MKEGSRNRIDRLEVSLQPQRSGPGSLGEVRSNSQYVRVPGEPEKSFPIERFSAKGMVQLVIAVVRCPIEFLGLRLFDCGVVDLDLEIEVESFPDRGGDHRLSVKRNLGPDRSQDATPRISSRNVMRFDQG